MFAYKVTGCNILCNKVVDEKEYMLPLNEQWIWLKKWKY